MTETRIPTPTEAAAAAAETLVARRTASAAEHCAFAASRLASCYAAAAKVHRLAALNRPATMVDVFTAGEQSRHARADATVIQERAEELSLQANALVSAAPGRWALSMAATRCAQMADEADKAATAARVAAEALNAAVAAAGTGDGRTVAREVLRELAETLIRDEGTKLLEVGDWTDVAHSVAWTDEHLPRGHRLSAEELSDLEELIAGARIVLPELPE